MDPNNIIVKLCIEGMRAEGAGRNDDARALFQQAWDKQIDDYDACIAAHYLARQQPTEQEKLHWNEEALRRADAVGDERVVDFYPSLLLNVGSSYETLGDQDRAREYYQRALASMDTVSTAAQAWHVRESLERALERIG